MITSTAVVFSLLSIVTGGSLDPRTVPATAWPSVFAIGFLASFLAIQAFYAGARRVGAAQAALLSTVEPAIIVTLAWVFLGQRLEPIQFVGAGLIMVSVVVVAGFVGADADRSLRHHEFTSLVASSIDGRATAQHAEAVVESTRAYTMPLLGSAQPDVRAGLAQLIANSASQGVDAVRAVRGKVAGTLVLPWHGSLRAAKADELRYLDAWAVYLDTVARGGTATSGTLSPLCMISPTRSSRRPITPPG
jgi:uncharacterized membrane protein